jgi:hypothetical protein
VIFNLFSLYLFTNFRRPDKFFVNFRGNSQGAGVSIVSSISAASLLLLVSLLLLACLQLMACLLLLAFLLLLASL